MERAWSRVALRHHPWGWMGRIGTRALAGLAVSKCALTAEGCAPAAPYLLTFCCNCFTMRPHDGATTDEQLGERVPKTPQPVGRRLTRRRDRGSRCRHAPDRRAGEGRSPGSMLKALEPGDHADRPGTEAISQRAAISEARLSAVGPTTTWTTRPERTTPKAPAARSASSSTFV